MVFEDLVTFLDASVIDLPISDKDDILEVFFDTFLSDDTGICSASSLHFGDDFLKLLFVGNHKMTIPKVDGLNIRAVEGKDFTDGFPVVGRASNRARHVQKELKVLRLLLDIHEFFIK